MHINNLLLVKISHKCVTIHELTDDWHKVQNLGIVTDLNGATFVLVVINVVVTGASLYCRLIMHRLFERHQRTHVSPSCGHFCWG